uniref:NADH-ubiquinone oxidoreductase chain 3 n=1 Tax=Cantacader sp. TaxID=2931283 RepID=A0A8T9ZXS6_9HEMI|nr:NADH dehydrogenase subunit 3 [Cantacader sp.]
MMIMKINFILVMLLSSALSMIMFVMSKKLINEREKMSPFECGFDPKSSSRMSFSIQFFLTAMLFLIFDIEIMIIMPMILSIKYSNIMNWTIVMSLFITTLILGLYYEWKSGVLEWKK